MDRRPYILGLRYNFVNEFVRDRDHGTLACGVLGCAAWGWLRACRRRAYRGRLLSGSVAS